MARGVAMATQQQFSYFKSIYDEENARQTSLQDRAKNYLSLITFYSAFILFVVQNLKPDTLTFKLVFVTMIASMLAAFLLSLWSIQVSQYEVPSDPAEIIHHFGKAPQEDSDFFDARLVDYTAAYTHNSKVNDRKAFQLTLAGYLVLAGIFMHAIYILLKII
jgi:hypothetical protein